ncbi:hypothetical protein [Mycobacterium sp. URHB0021]
MGELDRPSSWAHGRRDTNAYPPTANTTGIIINIPNKVLIITFSIPLCPLSRWQANTAVTIGQRLIYRPGSVYT